jgi:hypothetical protein
MFDAPLTAVSREDQARRMAEPSVSAHLMHRHMWTAPIGKLFFDVTNDLVSFSHMSGLLVRHDSRWP